MTVVEEQQLAAMTSFMQAVLGGDETGHDTSHIDRVVALTKHILATEPTADAFIAIAAATLHDTYDDKLFKDVTSAKRAVGAMLADNGVNEAQQAEIFQIIDNMSWSKQRFGNPEPLSLAGQIVQDADRLDAIGAVATARAIQYGSVKRRTLYDPAINPQIFTSKADYRAADDETTMNHFYEKLFLLKDYLNTREGKRIGTIRDRAMHDFVAQFEAEWAGTDYLD